jgi:hypothetical protein
MLVQCTSDPLTAVVETKQNDGSVSENLSSHIRCVDQGTGSDNNPGTMDRPWKTVQHAVNNVLPGDTILIRKGEYGTKGVPINFFSGSSGTSEKWITIRGYPRQSAVILGGFDTRGSSWASKGGAWLRIEGLVINGPVLIHNTQDAPVEIIDNKFDFFPKGGTAIKGSDHSSARQKNVIIKNNHIYGATIGIHTGEAAYTKNWLVENNIIERLIYPGTGDADYIRLFGEGHIFRGNILFGTKSREKGAAHTDGFQTFTRGASNILIENNIDSGFDEGIMASVSTGAVNKNWIVRNNIFSGTYADSLPGGSFGIDIHPTVGSAQNWTIVNNVFANNRYYGIAMGANASKMTVKNNFFYNSTMYTRLDYKRSDMFIGNNMTNMSTKSQISTDIVNINAALVFVNPVKVYHDPLSNPNRFDLRKNSPAIDAGARIPGLVDYDRYNTRRPQGSGWDIGPYEFAHIPLSIVKRK